MKYFFDFDKLLSMLQSESNLVFDDFDGVWLHDGARLIFGAVSKFTDKKLKLGRTTANYTNRLIRRFYYVSRDIQFNLQLIVIDNCLKTLIPDKPVWLLQ